MKKAVVVLVAVVVLASVFAIASRRYGAEQVEKLGFLAQENAATFVRPHSITLGPADARVHLVEFFDPGCETCRQFADPVKALLEEHPGRVRLVLRYAPFHEGADVMARILEAARAQGKYWETLQIMYDSQPLWANHHDPRPDMIWAFLNDRGIDVERLRIDMEAPALYALVQQDIVDAQTLGVQKTPSFFVNGKPLQQFGYAQLRALVQAEVAAQYD